MLLSDKRLLITGVINDRSIAYTVARLAVEQGAEIALTGFGRGLRLTEQYGRRLVADCPVLELDATQPDQLAAAADWCAQRWGRLDGVLHSIAYAPANTLDGGFVAAPWSDVATVLEVSAYTFAAFGRVFGSLLAASPSGSLVGLDFDASVAWPGYDWMGVAKAALESCCRYLADALGPSGTRVNLVAAGPLKTIAASAIGSFADLQRSWQESAPLGWTDQDAEAVARAVCALWSDWLPQVTGEVLHVDGGMHAIGGGRAKTARSELLKAAG